MNRVRQELHLALRMWLILTASAVAGTVAYVGMRMVSTSESATAGAMGVSFVVMGVLRLKFYEGVKLGVIER